MNMWKIKDKKQKCSNPNLQHIFLFLLVLNHVSEEQQSDVHNYKLNEIVTHLNSNLVTKVPKDD